MKYVYTVLDRDGGIIAQSDDLYDTYDAAYLAGWFWDDDPRYGSHEVEEVDDE